MQNLSFNDLIGLPYQWGAAPWSGKTDCFQLACEVHKRLGFADYSNQFEWVYELYDESNIFLKGCWCGGCCKMASAYNRHALGLSQCCLHQWDLP
jgi:hypothetical protein